MDSILPFSVLKSKRTKDFKVVIEQEKVYTIKNRQTEHEKDMNAFLNLGLFYYPEQVAFINRYISYFYRNNLIVLFLCLNILRNPEFQRTEYYNLYVNNIRRVDLKDQKQDMFLNRLNKQIEAYMKKIQTLMSREGISTYI